MACWMAIPAAPPATALLPKAKRKIAANMAPTLLIWVKNTISEPMMYSTAMNGTTARRRCMRCRPPMTISAREDHQHNAAGQRNHAHAAHGSSHAAEERGFHIQDDLIDLPHIADAEGCQNGKNGEQNRKDTADGLAVLPAARPSFR